MRFDCLYVYHIRLRHFVEKKKNNNNTKLHIKHIKHIKLFTPTQHIHYKSCFHFSVSVYIEERSILESYY